VAPRGLARIVSPDSRSVPQKNKVRLCSVVCYVVWPRQHPSAYKLSTQAQRLDENMSPRSLTHTYPSPPPSSRLAPPPSHHSTSHQITYTHTPPLLPPPPALHLHHPPHFHSILPHTQHKGSPLQTFLGRVLFHKIWARMFPSRNSRDRVSNCFFAAASFCLDEWLRWDWRGSVVIV
jgi:hypothetical protein